MTFNVNQNCASVFPAPRFDTLILAEKSAVEEVFSKQLPTGFMDLLLDEGVGDGLVKDWPKCIFQVKPDDDTFLLGPPHILYDWTQNKVVLQTAFSWDEALSAGSAKRQWLSLSAIKRLARQPANSLPAVQTREITLQLPGSSTSPYFFFFTLIYLQSSSDYLSEYVKIIPVRQLLLQLHRNPAEPKKLRPQCTTFLAERPRSDTFHWDRLYKLIEKPRTDRVEQPRSR